MCAAKRWARGWRLAALVAFCALLCAGCAGQPAHVDEVAVAAPAPTSTPPPTATAPPPTATPTLPTPNSPTPDLNRPPRVGLQVGHWRIEEHPDEQARLRKFSGTYYRGYDEWELNIVIARATQALLEAEGVTVDLLPAVVPIGYEADAFLSIHVDGVTGPTAETRRGWKVATPFRASRASEGLAGALAAAYPAVTGLPSDNEEASINLRAYYAFAAYRYWHSIAPTTPAAIVEVGFMTHPADRKLILEQPELLAEGLARGVLDYLAIYYPLDEAERAPLGRGMLRPTRDGVTLYERASDASAPLLEVGQNTRLVPLGERKGWVLVFTHGGDWDLGWVRAEEVVKTGEELAPPHPRPTESEA